MAAMKVPYDQGEEGDLEVFKKLAMSQPAEDFAYEKNLPQLPVEPVQSPSSAAGTLSLLLVPEPGPVVHRKVQRELAPRGLRELILPRLVEAEVSTDSTFHSSMLYIRINLCSWVMSCGPQKDCTVEVQRRWMDGGR